MKGIVHKELSYRIVGILFKIYNELGYGFQEKYYQKAVKSAFEENEISYLEQVKTNFDFGKKSLGKYYIDFIVDHKIVLEIKVKPYFSPQDVRQVLGYLKKSNLELGILAGFTKDGIKYKRILRGYN